MTCYCKRYDKCFFPREVEKGKSQRNDIEKYINSCNFGEMDCELMQLSDIEFKVYERFEK